MNNNVVYTKDLVYNKKFPTVILVESVQVLDGYRVRVRFNDGVEKDIDLEPVIWGPVFEPMRNDLEFFRQVYVDSISKTLTWPNEVDLDPDSLYYGDQEAPWWTEYKKQEQKKKKARQQRARTARKTTTARRVMVKTQARKKPIAKSRPRKMGLAKKK